MSPKNPKTEGPLIPLADVLSCTGVSRRQFCGAVGLGLVSLGLPACDLGAQRISTGQIDDSTGIPYTGGGKPDAGLASNPTPDFGSSSNGDAGKPGNGNPDLASGQMNSPDLAQAGSSCPASNVVNAGAASAITMGMAKHLTDNFTYNLLVCRDSRGLYAMSASCTHAGVTVIQQSGQFYCPRHGATFDLNGQNPTSPAFSPLNHYALCIDGSGNAIVDYNNTVSPSTRA